MRKTNFFQFIFLILSSILYGQDVILNGGFENGNHQGAFQSPANAFQSDLTADFLDYWRRAEDNDGIIYHSPDWRYIGWLNFGRNYNYDNNPYGAFYAPTGNGMLGMAPAELIQQGYNVNLLVNSLDGLVNPKVRLRFKIRLSDHTYMDSSTKLSFYLSKRKLKYKSIDNACANSNRYHEFSTDYNQYVSIYNDDNLLNKYPPGQWHQVEQLVTLPSGIEDYDWIAINLNTFENGTLHCGNNEYCCTNEYLYIDDVELIVGCEDSCSNTDGPINTALWGNLITASNYTRITNLDNVSSLNFDLFSNSGDLVYSNSVQCPNGIGHDIYWDGKSLGGSNVANASYHYVLTAKNDCYEKKYTGTLVKNQDYTGPIVANFEQQCSKGLNITPEICCLENEYLDNLLLKGPINSDYIVRKNIWVCTAAPDFSDEVRVLSNADILFQAGNKIVLAEGFNTEPGATFVAQILGSFCDGHKGNLSGDTGKTAIVSKKNIDLEQELDPSVIIYPNPTTNSITIRKLNMEDGLIEMYNINGQLINTATFTKSSELVFDLSSQPPGIYIVKITTTNQVIKQKVVKQ